MKYSRTFASAAVLLLLAAGCRQEMAEQPKFQPLSAARELPGGLSARYPPRGTVAQGEMAANELVPRPVNNVYPPGFPFALTIQSVRRGKERYGIFCGPCHGLAGDADGEVVRRGFPAPPSFHIERLQNAAPAYIVDVETRGNGKMASYSKQIPITDRWLIASYIKALQLSRQAKPEDATPEARRLLEETKQGGLK